jgi:hypothetical protein
MRIALSPICGAHVRDASGRRVLAFSRALFVCVSVTIGGSKKYNYNVPRENGETDPLGESSEAEQQLARIDEVP